MWRLQSKISAKVFYFKRLIPVFFLLLLWPTSYAQTVYTVTNTNDAGTGSLRQAVINANANPGLDNILFDPLLTNTIITLTSGQLSITEQVTIDASAIGYITIDGGWNNAGKNNVGSRIFFIDLNLGGGSTQRDVLLKGIHMVNGNAGSTDGGADFNQPRSNGGAIYAEQVNLYLEDVEISNSTANDGGGLKAVGSRLFFDRVSIHNNLARDDGGGIDYGDGSSLEMYNSTVAYNLTGFATSGSGSNSNGALKGNGNTTIEYSTIAFNTSDDDANIGGSGNKTFRNSIILDNILDTGAVLNCSGTIIDGGGNWTNSSGSCLASMNQSNNSAIQLSTTLNLNRGTTRSLAMPCTSILFNAVTTSNCGMSVGGTDQRGLLRGMYGNCEPGAFEIECEDSDLDGVSNSFDLDDDNDGILDTVESNGNNPDGDADGDGTVNWLDTFDDGGTGDGSSTDYADVDNNGVPDVYDADNSGNPNHTQSNSDGDTCSDTIEAGFSDMDNDNILGTSPISVDVDGLVTGHGGYTTPLDQNSNSVFDFLEVIVTSSVIVQPSNQTLVAGQEATFAATVTNGDTYQWQVSTDGGATFSDLTDGGIFSGTQTDELRISNVDIEVNNRLFRLLSSDSNYACDTPSESDMALLLVRVGSVITNRRITLRVNKN